MCLSALIKDEFLDRVKRDYDSITGYKVLYLPEGEKNYRSLYKHKIWEKNKTGIHSSDRISTILGEEGDIERSYDYLYDGCISRNVGYYVYKGFHFYRTREDAREGKRREGGCNAGRKYHIIKFEVKTKDLVAFSDDMGSSQFVATKAKWIGRVK